MIEKIRKRLYEILEIAEPEDKVSVSVDAFLFSLILLNIFAVIIGTVDSINTIYANYLYGFKLFSMIVFSVEFILRIWVSNYCTNQCDSTIFIKRLFNPLIFLDLLVILSFFLSMLISIDLRFLRIFRLFRLLRSFKIGRYSESLNALEQVLKNEKEELFIIILIIFSLLVTSASLMYYVEHKAQPEVFTSIPSALWWGIITLTTVGYGDIYPITALGKFLGALIALLGLGMFALPTGVIAFGFMDELQRRRANKGQCPHCGKHLHNTSNTPPT